jgi:hypothetical protein
MLNNMALRLIQIKLPDAEYDSITEIIADQKFITTWPDHRVPGQRILQLVEPAMRLTDRVPVTGDRRKTSSGFTLMALTNM